MSLLLHRTPPRCLPLKGEGEAAEEGAEEEEAAGA